MSPPVSAAGTPPIGTADAPATTRPYQVCVRCVMDTSDPDITFDASGVCSHCHHFDSVVAPEWHPGPEGRVMLESLLSQVKAEGRGRDYDCALGLSGGVDSSYLALKMKEFGLRVLCVHVDGGWNSELAVSNIETVVRHCGFDLHTHVVDWGDMRDLQLAYLRSGVANQDVPQDHAFFATLFHFATRANIRTVLSGGNIATEGIFPRSWHGSAMDSINLKAIHTRFGTRPLKHYGTISFWQYYFWYPFVKRMRVLHPLNYLPYHKAAAVDELERVGWRSYGRKHGESLFTKFFQNYYLPTRFGYDKRRPHLASLIVSGQTTREAALQALQEPLYDPLELETDLRYFAKKVNITREQLAQYLAEPTRDYTEFPNWDGLYTRMKKVQRAVERVRGSKIKAYW